MITFDKLMNLIHQFYLLETKHLKVDETEINLSIKLVANYLFGKNQKNMGFSAFRK